MKAAIFHPAALTAIRSFPDDVRRELGKAIFDLQKGQRSGNACIPVHAFDSNWRRRVENPRPVWNLSGFLLQPVTAGHSSISRVREEDPDNTGTRVGFGKEAVKGVAP